MQSHKTAEIENKRYGGKWRSQRWSAWFHLVCKERSGWVTDKLKVQSVTDSLAAIDDWQQADGFLHAEA